MAAAVLLVQSTDPQDDHTPSSPLNVSRIVGRCHEDLAHCVLAEVGGRNGELAVEGKDREALRSAREEANMDDEARMDPALAYSHHRCSFCVHQDFEVARCQDMVVLALATEIFSASVLAGSS